MKGVTAKEVAHGCGGGCLGCLGALAGLVVLGWVGLWLPANHYEKWSGFPGSLDKLRPGMTVEEAKAVFPAHCTFEEEETSEFGWHTWVTGQDAVPARKLTARAAEPESFLLMYGCFVAHFSDSAWLFFDADGGLVGVQELAWEDGTWKAEWGELFEERGKGEPCVPCEDDGAGEGGA